LGQPILAGETDLAALADRVTSGEIDPSPVSGRQELLENIVNRAIWSVDAAERATAAADR
jgi:xylose isomerase